MYEQVIERKGQSAGPTSIVLVGVHGNELCGVNALEEILQTLNVEKGRVIFCYGNPKAIIDNKRFIEQNLNRMFKDSSVLTKDEKVSYEFARAQFLKPYLLSASALLDVHASLTPESQPFIICEPNALSIAEYLPVSRVVSGFDAIEPGGTDCFMNINGRMGICIECGYTNDPQSTALAKEGILSFLRVRGHIKGDTIIRQQEHVHMYDLYRTKTNIFKLTKQFKDFEYIESGQLVGFDGDEKIVAEKDCVILFARNRERVGDEAFLLGEKKIARASKTIDPGFTRQNF